MKRIKLFISPDKLEALSGWASLWPVDGIWEQEDHLELFVAADHVDFVISAVEELPDTLTCQVDIQEMEEVNWNQEWESNFKPVQVGDFCLIYAPFHQDLPECTYNIKLTPKMAFGTGHHETTYMMIEQMSKLDFADKTVLDFGCGTAILSVLADKMGAKNIFAIDNEEPAIDNSVENAEINEAQNIRVQLGVLDDVPVREYDIILANINFNVLIQTAEQLKTLVHHDSYLLLSGILVEKKELIKDEYQSKGWDVLNEQIKGEWTSMLLKLGHRLA